MGRNVKPTERDLSAETAQIRQFYNQLSQLQPLGEAFVDPTEQLSIPELIKRLITYDAIAARLNLKPNELPSVKIPKTFRDLNRQDRGWTGWFQGDGDSIGTYLRKLAGSSKEADALTQFSQAMLDWGRNH